MIIAYNGSAGHIGLCYNCAEFVPGCVYGTDSVWMVPGTFDDEGVSLIWSH